MEKILFKDYPNIETLIDANNLNTMQDNVEASIIEVDTKISTGWQSLGATVTFSSADAPTFVVTTSIDCTGFVGLGNRLKLTHGGVVKYFIVTAITSNSITLYGGTDYTLSDTEITLPYYSNVKAPFGFPLSPDKWTIKYSATATTFITNPVSNQWYNLATLNLPIGLWDVTYNAVIATTANGTSPNRCYITIGQNSASMGSAGCMTGVNTGGIEATSLAPATNNQLFDLTNPGTIYLTFLTNQLAKSMVDVYANGTATTIKAVCGYL